MGEQCHLTKIVSCKNQYPIPEMGKFYFLALDRVPYILHTNLHGSVTANVSGNCQSYHGELLKRLFISTYFRGWMKTATLILFILYVTN